MHGYDPAEDDKMLGFAVLTRVGSDQPGRDLGKLDTLRLHPTVAKLLSIEPAAGTNSRRPSRCRKTSCSIEIERSSMDHRTCFA